MYEQTENAPGQKSRRIFRPVVDCLSGIFPDSGTLFLGRVVLLVTIAAAVDLVFLVRKIENLVQTLLDG
jgi:hypothetical protein